MYQQMTSKSMHFLYRFLCQSIMPMILLSTTPQLFLLACFSSARSRRSTPARFPRCQISSSHHLTYAQYALSFAAAHPVRQGQYAATCLRAIGDWRMEEQEMGQ